MTRVFWRNWHRSFGDTNRNVTMFQQSTWAVRSLLRFRSDSLAEMQLHKLPRDYWEVASSNHDLPSRFRKGGHAPKSSLQGDPMIRFLKTKLGWIQCSNPASIVGTKLTNAGLASGSRIFNFQLIYFAPKARSGTKSCSSLGFEKMFHRASIKVKLGRFR